MATTDEALRAQPAVRRPRPGGGMSWLHRGILLGAMAPLLSITYRGSQGLLSANPIAEVENELGLAALVLLVASLACTPARWLLGWTWTVRIRRDLGLLAFLYGVLHFLVYLFDQSGDWPTIVEDVVQRPFITVGFLALVLMVPLALTSTTASIRRLGFKRWTRLHQLAYVAGVLAVVHFFWRVKIDVSQPMVYAGVVAALLGVRLAFYLRQRASKASAATKR